MAEKGYTRKTPPAENRAVEKFATVQTGANPLEFVEGDAFNTVDHPGNGKADGDNPTFAAVPFANGKDNRYRG